MTFQVYYGGVIWEKDEKLQGALNDKIGLESVDMVGRTVARIAKIVKSGLQTIKE